MPLKKVTDGPLFGQPEGTLSNLQNMTLTPDGYAEARGGFQKPQLVGGTPTDAISTGGYSDAIELATSYGWIKVYDANSNTYLGTNFQLHAGGWKCFGTGIVNDAFYWGADYPFSRIAMSLTRAMVTVSNTVVYEYWNGAAWTAFAATPETFNFGSTYALQYASWRMPIDWAATVTTPTGGNGNVYKYWMRVRLGAVNTLTVLPLVLTAYGFWVGMREIYVSTANPRAGTSLGTLRRYGMSGTTSEWFATDGGNLSALHAIPNRLSTYRGRVIVTNSKETKRWDGTNFVNLGINGTAPLVGLATPAALAAGMGAGVWRYYYAYGNGPCQNTEVYADRQDAKALYGPGRVYAVASSVGGFDVTTTAGANERVQLELITTPTTEISAIYIYRTDDLTAVPSGKRANYPAYLIQSMRILNNATSPLGFEQAWGGAGNFYFDTSVDQAFPRQEAITFDNAPPTRCKWSTVYQNRLFLMDDDAIYWSEPFQIDLFNGKDTTNYIRLNRAEGGRNMGMIEFADQIIAYTENQTWGISNVDLDIAQLYPIRPDVGCVAPDAAASGDGWAMWPARDGFYKWSGGRQMPVKCSEDFDQTFFKMSYETHGGSRATIADHKYIFRPATPDGTALGTTCYVYDLVNSTWSTLVPTSFASSIYPLANVHAPVGNADAGGTHSLWAKIDYGTGAAEYSVFLGEITTQDNGVNFTCSGTEYFPQPPAQMFKPRNARAYYSAPDGWGTPSLSFATASVIGSSPGSLTSGTPDTGTDYSMVGATFSGVSSGTSDLQVTFSVASAAGGTINLQRFYGIVLEGEMADVRRGSV